MGAARIADLAIVAAELASNLVKHADEGSLLLRPVRRAGQAGVELVAIDSGPGMADVDRLVLGDGHSTAGTLGIGLGAIVRQASWFDGYSLPGRGTVLAVQVWPAEPAPSRPGPAALTRPLTGETVSGDGYAVAGRRRPPPGAGQRRARARPAGRRRHRRGAGRVPRRPGRPAGDGGRVTCTAAMSHTRGAALAVAELDPGGRGAALRRPGQHLRRRRRPGDGRRRGLVSLPGIAGHQRPTIREYDYPLAAGAPAGDAQRRGGRPVAAGRLPGPARSDPRW